MVYINSGVSVKKKENKDPGKTEPSIADPAGEGGKKHEIYAVAFVMTYFTGPGPPGSATGHF